MRVDEASHHRQGQAVDVLAEVPDERRAAHTGLEKHIHGLVLELLQWGHLIDLLRESLRRLWLFHPPDSPGSAPRVQFHLPLHSVSLMFSFLEAALAQPECGRAVPDAERGSQRVPPPCPLESPWHGDGIGTRRGD